MAGVCLTEGRGDQCNSASYRAAVAKFVELYNSRWLIERHGHSTPREAYAAAMARVAA